MLPSFAKDCLDPEREKDNSAPHLDVPPLPHFGGIFVPGSEAFSGSTILNLSVGRSLGNKSPQCSCDTEEANVGASDPPTFTGLRAAPKFRTA